MVREMPRNRKHKVFDKFYVNKYGEPAEHLSARGGITKVRRQNWNAIKECQSIDEIRVLIGKFRSEIKGLDKKNDSKMITEWRTAITMAGDYYHYLKHEEECNGKYSDVSGPPTNTSEQDVSGNETTDEEGNAIYGEDQEPDAITTDLKVDKGIERPRDRFDSSIEGYHQHGVVVGEVPWYNSHVQQRVQEIHDRNLRNRLESRKSDPDLRAIYSGWRYDKEFKKKKKDDGG